MAYERDGEIVNALVHQVAFTRILPLFDKIQYPPTSKLIVTTFFFPFVNREQWRRKSMIDRLVVW